MSGRRIRTVFLVLIGVCSPAFASAQIRLTLDDKFIDDFKNRVVITADVKFKIALREDPTFVTDDGLFVRCDVLSLDGDVLVKGRRMAFVKGTSAFTAVMKKKRGGTLTVLGIPRIDQALVAWRVEHGDSDPGVLNWNLPSEMIIVGSFGS